MKSCDLISIFMVNVIKSAGNRFGLGSYREENTRSAFVPPELPELEHNPGILKRKATFVSVFLRFYFPPTINGVIRANPKFGARIKHISRFSRSVSSSRVSRVTSAYLRVKRTQHSGAPRRKNPLWSVRKIKDRREDESWRGRAGEHGRVVPGQ